MEDHDGYQLRKNNFKSTQDIKKAIQAAKKRLNPSGNVQYLDPNKLKIESFAEPHSSITNTPVATTPLNETSSGSAKKVLFTQQTTKRVNHFIKIKSSQQAKPGPIENPFAVFLKNGLPLQFPKEKAESCSRMIRQQYSKAQLETVEIIREEMIQKKKNKMKNEFA